MFLAYPTRRGSTMVNSPLPVNHEIRVLTTIKNGIVTSEEVLPEKMLIATLDEFMEAAIKAGTFRDLTVRAKG